MGSGVKFILGNNVNSDPSIVYTEIQKNLKELGSAEERQKYIAKYIDKITTEDLEKYGISKADAKDIKTALKEIYEANNKDLNTFRSKILSEVEKLKNNVNK
jgi:cell fate regulator YaaT (PSP1 superfamily)